MKHRADVPPPLPRWSLRRVAVAGALVVLCVLIGGPTAVHAQRTTERFIPIGQSPGLSGQVTLIGAVQAVDRPGQVITIADSTGSYAVAYTERTEIWIDRSALNQPSLDGAAEDIQEDMRIEVKFVGNDRDAPAEWIKVAAPDTSGGG